MPTRREVLATAAMTGMAVAGGAVAEGAVAAGEAAEATSSRLHWNEELAELLKYRDLYGPFPKNNAISIPFAAIPMYGMWKPEGVSLEVPPPRLPGLLRAFSDPSQSGAAHDVNLVCSFLLLRELHPLTPMFELADAQGISRWRSSEQGQPYEIQRQPQRVVSLRYCFDRDEMDTRHVAWSVLDSVYSIAQEVRQIQKRHKIVRLFTPPETYLTSKAYEREFLAWCTLLVSPASAV